jgi:hypothetical protein
MLADLKEKAAGVDRKRIYTAAAALLIAGAAGHFMQQTSGGSRSPAVMSASVPAVSAPEILSAPAGTEPADVVAVRVPEILPAEPEPTAVGDSLADAATSAPDIVAPDPEPGTSAGPVADATGADTVDAQAPEIIVAAPVTTPRPAPKPVIIPETGTASTAIYPAPKADLMLEEVTRAASDPLLTITEPTPDRPKDSMFAAASDDLDMPPPAAVAPAEPDLAGCAVSVEGTAKPGAMLEIRITAPCNSGEIISFEHTGLKFAEQIGPDGTLTVSVPAMTGMATVSLDFADGGEQDVEVTVPDFETYDRIAVIWQGATGLQLHALEGGADYGEAGHVWADTPAGPDAAVAGMGGFISVLGNTASGFAADVYTYPSALMRDGVEPEISIEAQVMENTCGGVIEGWLLRTNPAGAPHVEPAHHGGARLRLDRRISGVEKPAGRAETRAQVTRKFRGPG